MYRDNSDVADVNAVQNVLQELMRHIILLQSSSRRGGDMPMRNESSMSRNRSANEERQQQITRQVAFILSQLMSLAQHLLRISLKSKVQTLFLIYFLVKWSHLLFILLWLMSFLVFFLKLGSIDTILKMLNVKCWIDVNVYNTIVVIFYRLFYIKE